MMHWQSGDHYNVDAIAKWLLFFPQVSHGVSFMPIIHNLTFSPKFGPIFCSLHPSQQLISHAWTGLPGLNQY